jgi:hypothetical protein
VIGFQWTFLFSDMIPVTGSQADRFRKAAMKCIWGVVLAALVLIPPSSLANGTYLSQQVNGPALTIIRGRAVCLDATGREVRSVFGCPETSTLFAFAAADGKLYRFLSGDTMAPVFTDSRVRQQELQITGRLHGRDQLEIIKVQLVKAGKIFDIFYYCDVCSITAYVPGLCPCCRNELEFRESAQ